MKKLFFFRPTSSSNKENNIWPAPSVKNTETFWEKPPESTEDNSDEVKRNFESPRSLSSKSRKQVSESRSPGTSSAFRRCHSFSSAGSRKGIPGGHVELSYPDDHFRLSSPSCRSLTPKRQYGTRKVEPKGFQNVNKFERTGSAGSFDSAHEFADCSSSQSSSVFSTKVVDRYIDGEQHSERNSVIKSSSRRGRNRSRNRDINDGVRRPPLTKYTETASPPNGFKEKPKSNSFRETKCYRLHSASKDRPDTISGHESPRRLAKNVIEKLSQCHGLPKTDSNAFKPGIPITLEDVYGGSMNRCSNSNVDKLSETNHSYYAEDYLNSQRQACVKDETEDNLDVELHRKMKEADERVMFLSEELSQDSFLDDAGFDFPGLVRTIRYITEERKRLALEVARLLEDRITERAAAKEEVRLVKASMDAATRRLEREKNEIQLGLEKELDRRSSDWTLKLDRFHTEEQRLRDRVRELAEQNVSLQREATAFSEKEIQSRITMEYSKKQLEELTTKAENVRIENSKLHKDLLELREMCRGTDEDRDFSRRNYEDKDKECTELHKSVSRLLRTCSEHEKTIEGLSDGIRDESDKTQSDKKARKLQLEQVRLIEVERAIRKELQSYQTEVSSLRHENISLLNRLRVNGKEGEYSTLKLDQELWSRVCFLQNQGLSLLNESTQACSKLLEFIKRKSGDAPEVNLIELETKVQGYKRGTESLARSLQSVSSLLQDKFKPLDQALPSHSKDDHGSSQAGVQNSEDILKGELKAETLLTRLCLQFWETKFGSAGLKPNRLLHERLYSKELEVEQLQAELATAVRGNDILKCEAQCAMDILSRASHKLTDFELQALKKDENISRMQSDLEETSKELTATKGILPRVIEERDLVWEEVKQHREKNMLLNKEVVELKKKIEILDEALLVKEGELTILKDALRKRPFDLLSTDSTRDF